MTTPAKPTLTKPTQAKQTLTDRLLHSFMAASEAAVAIRYDAPWTDRSGTRSAGATTPRTGT